MLSTYEKAEEKNSNIEFIDTFPIVYGAINKFDAIQHSKRSNK